jgi:hypothetical protein
MVNKLTSDDTSGRFVVQKFMLGCSFECYKIRNNHYYGFGHTLLCCLSQTYMYNKNTLEVGSLNKSSCLAAALDVTKFPTIPITNLVILCCAA